MKSYRRFSATQNIKQLCFSANQSFFLVGYEGGPENPNPFIMKKMIFYLLIGLAALILIPLLVAVPIYKRQMNAAKARLNSESKILSTRLGKMEYAVRGEGKPVLLVHGAGGGFDQGLWIGRICLVGDYQFIAPSKFGYLNSEIPDGYSAELQAQQYSTLLDHLGIERVSVIAVSAGGPSAMQFANDFPERMENLVLLSAVSMPPNANDKSPFFIHIIQMIQQSDLAYWLFTKAFKTQILSLFGIPAEEYRKFTPEQKNLADDLLNVMHPMSLRYNGTLIDGKIIQDFVIPDSITVSTLVLHARNDGLVSYEHAENSHRNIRSSKLILYENGGHGAISQLENVREEIQRFLKD